MKNAERSVLLVILFAIVAAVVAACGAAARGRGSAVAAPAGSASTGAPVPSAGGPPAGGSGAPPPAPPASGTPPQSNTGSASDGGASAPSSTNHDDEEAPGDCHHRLTFCIDMSGTAVEHERDPRVGPGESLTVRVYDTESSAYGKIVKLEASTGSAPSVRFFPDKPAAAPPRPPTNPGDAGASDAATPASAIRSTQGAAASGANAGGIDASETRKSLVEIHLADIPASSTITVYLRVYKKGNAATPELERPLNFAIGRNGFYFEPVFVFPTIFQGNRSILRADLANGRESVVYLSNSNIGAFEELSLGVNVYPFGYPGSCKSPSSLASDLMPFVCDPEHVLKPLTFQLGTSITRNAFREYLLGGGYSIVRGISLTFGVAFVRGDFFGPTLFDGQLLGRDVPTPGGGIEEKLMLRPYFGVALSPEILQAALEVLSKAKSIAPAHAAE